MRTSGTPSRGNLLEFEKQSGEIQDTLLRWIVGITKSNERLIAALEQMRDAYKKLLDDQLRSPSNDLLWRVEHALSEARTARKLHLQEPGLPKRGGHRTHEPA